MKYDIIIGMEIHAQLKTKSKMFCACSNDGENQPPNSTICEICTGQPGTLPVAN
ncbi:MAG: Asp-tRNA(Asn)/Glu-tRNA(Gln) amidotransferase subunit GatB, partial [Patescibacteria group bacterium]|nr:Asp-tRNA(Asn)/Glu-tRNA(Gln) amidotransferase subunit GatB [Patescibacteria group bacterium]